MNPNESFAIKASVMKEENLDAFNILFEHTEYRTPSVTYNEVSELYDQTKHLISEVEEIANHIHNMNFTKKNETFLFDFDVIFSTVNWLSRNFTSNRVQSRNTFWSSLSYELFVDQSFILPGTAFELVSFLRFNSSRSGRILSSPFADTFVEDFLAKTSPDGGGSSDYYDAVASLKKIDLSLSTLFVVAEMIDRHSNHEYVLKRKSLTYDEDIYQDTYDFLMRRRNRRKPINTMIDATNYALVTDLNKSIQIPIDSFHTILTNTRPLQQIPSYISSFENKSVMMEPKDNGVASPRQAALYKLITDTYEDPFAAEQMAREWTHQIRKFRDRLFDCLSNRTDGDIISVEELKSVDGVTSLIWSFEKIQERIDAARHNQHNRLELFTREFLPDQIGEFTKLALEFFKGNVLNTDISKKIITKSHEDNEQYTNKMIPEFEIAVFGDKILKEFGLKAGFTASTGERHYNFCAEVDQVKFWTKAESIEKNFFIDTVMELVFRISNLALRDVLKIKKEYGEELVASFSKGQWVFIIGDDILEIDSPMSDPINLITLQKRYKGEFENARLLRYECPLFAIGTDGKKLTFRTIRRFKKEMLLVAEELLQDTSGLLSSPPLHTQYEELDAGLTA